MEEVIAIFKRLGWTIRANDDRAVFIDPTDGGYFSLNNPTTREQQLIKYGWI